MWWKKRGLLRGYIWPQTCPYRSLEFDNIPVVPLGAHRSCNHLVSVPILIWYWEYGNGGWRDRRWRQGRRQRRHLSGPRRILPFGKSRGPVRYAGRRHIPQSNGCHGQSRPLLPWHPDSRLHDGASTWPKTDCSRLRCHPQIPPTIGVVSIRYRQ